MTLLNIEDAILEKETNNEIAIGIDFGTTNSLCYYYDGELIHEIMDLEPSIVYFDKSGNVVEKENSIYEIPSIKRHFGKNKQVEIANKKFWPEQIASEIFKKIKKEIDKVFVENVTKCVVTVPAYFDDTQRQSVKFSAELAGLEVMRMINEPTSAALYYGIDEREEGYYIVFDLGGGTFDISILKMQKGVIKVIATGGNTDLGGDDFDNAIAEKLNISKKDAKSIKEKLTENESVNVNGKIFTQNEFDDIVLPLVHNCVEIMQNVLKDSNIKQNDIKGLVLVGGSTRMPIIKEALKTEFSVPIFNDVDPDRVVAFGAALQARNIINKGTGNILLDVIPLSLGIETLGGAVQKIIERNSSIPIEKTVKFTTFQDWQTSIILNVVQGERDLAKDCRSLAKFELNNITRAKAGIPKIYVKFFVNENSILSVSAWEENEDGKNVETEIEVKPMYGIASEEVRKMLIDAIQNAQEDIEEKLIIDSIVDAQSVIKLAEDALKDSFVAIDDEIIKIQNVLSELKNAIDIRDRKKIDEFIKKLDATAKTFVERRTAWYLNDYVAGKTVDEI